MTTVFVKDDLRASVEAATGGLCTVLYTASGAPSFMRVIPKFRLEDVDAELGVGVHPAFIVDGFEKSEIFIGMYQGVIKNGELLSLPGVGPTVSQNQDAFINAGRACGDGFHLMTNAEWAAIALWCLKNGWTPRGNTNYGRAYDALWETGRRVDGGVPGDSNGSGRVLAGSGPISWRHDNSAAGIADLCGNIWEWNQGLRLVDGEIQILANNDAATYSGVQDAAPWKAIAQDGSLVAPGTAGTLKYDATGATGAGAAQIDDVIDSQSDGATYTYNTFASMVADTDITVPAIMKALGLFPLSTLAADDGMWARNIGTRAPLRGGYWGNGSDSGLLALHLRNAPSDVSWNIGGRPAKV